MIIDKHIDSYYLKERYIRSFLRNEFNRNTLYFCQINFCQKVRIPFILDRIPFILGRILVILGRILLDISDQNN